ncbi:hypothetical protein ABZX30_10435 [Streptomyces sp. NPDC004542]|uniref:hypothetical protein n=1 Tax=Streptomyces sp. NPDC004542 TaxID=3154281 RepID=UPI0033A31D51
MNAAVPAQPASGFRSMPRGGSPAGNGIHWGRLLRDGHVMEGTITGLGAQRTRCVAEKADATEGTS